MIHSTLRTSEDRNMVSVFLFAAPWMKASWPCLGIGLLKSFLTVSGIPVRCSHFHLETAARLGWARYDDLAETWGAGEALFGALFDPEDSARLVSVAVGLLRKANHPETAQWAESGACEDLRRMVDEWLERERPDQYSIVGGSVGAMQLCSTLYLIRRVRELGHSGWRVLGGAGLVGSVSGEVLARCRDIDAIIDGEGEHAMLAITERMRTGVETLSGLPQVRVRDSVRESTCCGTTTVDLSTAPAADLDEYFDSARKLGIPLTALNLSFEYSRGCEWEHRTKGTLRGCTFCGLYRNSPDHRRMPVEKALRQIEKIVQRYRVLDVAFVDAYIPPPYQRELLDGIIRMSSDISIFTEMRCDITRETAERLSKCARRIQLGVESFTNAILRRIGKGVRVLDTVYSVRICQEYGINLQYNLMTQIPGVSTDEINELYEVLPTLFGLVPPNIAEFYLDRNSIIYHDPAAFSIDVRTLDVEPPSWLASSLGDSRVLQVVPFAMDNHVAKDAWNRVAARVTQWRERFQSVKSNGIDSPLTWRDGGHWACVVDARLPVAHIYVLEGVLYDAFIASREVITERALRTALDQYDSVSISEALRQLLGRGLVLSDGTSYLSLPIHSLGAVPVAHPGTVRLNTSI
jgi:ribosomal peptide maturation radical SAM protein 1